MSEEYSVGYEAGYQDGWNAAVEQPVRTKDLTDDEICEVTGCNKDAPLWLAVSGIARAIIAADREKNK